MKMKSFKNIAIMGAVTALLYNCSKQSVDTTQTTEVSSFSLIQDKILTPSCATSGCHASGTDASFPQHGLVLAKGVAYQNMIGIAPKNANALADNLQRVKVYKSLESLLYHKLNWNSAHHSGKNYGSPMPLGGNPLSVGQLEFVRRWIEAGAPQTGRIADETLLDDKTPSYVTDNSNFTALSTPSAEGLTGYQLKLDQFTIQPNFEREIFVRKNIGNNEEIYVNRIKLKSRSNSHHLVLYDFRDRNSPLMPSLDAIRDLRNSDNTLNILTFAQMSNHIFLGGGTDANQDYTLPAGMALQLPANYSIDINPHYFNKTTGYLLGENYVNLYTTPKANVTQVVKMIDFNNTNFSLPAGKETTITTNFTFSKNVAIIMLTSHFHKYGTKFVIKINGGTRNGEIVYETTDWEHPLILNLKTPLLLKKGEGLTSVTTYNNTSNKTINFGLTSEDEMNIIFGYYYEN